MKTSQRTVLAAVLASLLPVAACDSGAPQPAPAPKLDATVKKPDLKKQLHTMPLDPRAKKR